MTPSLAKAELIYKDAPYIPSEADWQKNHDIDYILRGEWRYIKSEMRTRRLTDEEIESYMQQVYNNPAEADRREAEYLRFNPNQMDTQLYRYDSSIGYIVNNKTEERLVDEEARQAAAQSTPTPAPAQAEEDNSSNYEVPINDLADSQTSTDNLDASLVTDNFEKEDATLETESVETETEEEIESTEEVSEENTEESSEDTAPKKEEKKKSKNPIVRVAQGVGDVFVTLGNSIVHFFGGIGKAISNIF
ncbi:hypothetical protein [Lachnospira pectinoschiza]|uniref:Uncharacterized protein n=1 Tax=Lachnospira pectinoschiza TaxID=28052 RepID=A0A1G9WH27_9FIRM|nr:hypothetical protein [Lachnospira pectinoschiza]SDM83780.1 hypothetical protein SAMN05216544_1207 [Lachnospira pectinoschiza]